MSASVHGIHHLAARAEVRKKRRLPSVTLSKGTGD
jgi:hypothetical protein